MQLVVLGAVLAFPLALGVYEDKPCAAKHIVNHSVVCVCDAAYCDTIRRERPERGQYVTYVSTESGLRFSKSKRFLEEYDKNSTSPITIYLDSSKKYQTINGFGGAVTDAASINWNSLRDPALKQHLIESYCGDTGIQYSMLRVPIGGCDFSTHPYAYNELPEGDRELKNFTLAPEDYKFKIPMIKACMEASRKDIDIVASTWSPPDWMIDFYESHGVNFLKREYYQTYADYHRKFIEEYKKEGVPIWAVTTTNEPTNGAVNSTQFKDLGWTQPGMGEWIVKYFGPTMKKYYPEVKLLGVDDQRNTIPLWFNNIMFSWPDVAKVLDGIAVHFYNDQITPPAQLTEALKDYPDLFVISTEACIGAVQGIKVDLGSWDRAVVYAKDIIEDLNYNVIGWLDWNLCLDKHGGPNWANNEVDSPVIVMPEEGVFYKQPMFYAMGHFAKFVPRGSRKIYSHSITTSLEHMAVLTPDNTIVVVILNDEDKKKLVSITLMKKQAKVMLMARSITTVELSTQ